MNKANTRQKKSYLILWSLGLGLHWVAGLFWSYQGILATVSESDTDLVRKIEVSLQEEALTKTDPGSASDPQEVPLYRLEECDKVTVQGLDKVTGKVFTMVMVAGKPAKFGKLTILIKKAYQSPPEDKPETIAFLVVHESDPSRKESKLLFNNWMYASSPAISALQHPVYDIWVKPFSQK